MAYGDRQRLDQLAAAVNLDGGNAVPVDERLNTLRVAITGQEVPPPLTNWRMSNRSSALRLDALEPVVTAQQAVLTALLAGFDQQSAQVRVLTSQLQLAQAASQALQAGQAAEALRLTALEAKDVLLGSATEANRLDIVALKAADVTLQTRAGTDATAIATAQATATQARSEAARAQEKADLDATNLLAVLAQLTAVQATATAAQQAQAAFAARFRSARLTLPSIPLSGTIDVAVTWAPYADANFTAIAEPAGLVVLGLDATELMSARTASGTTFRIKNVAGLVVAAGGTLSFLVYHD